MPGLPLGAALDPTRVASLLFSLLPVNTDESAPVTGRISTPWTCVGSASLPRSRHDKIDRLSLTFSRKMRPTSMLTQPTENRKKAVTSGKSPT